MRLLTYNLLLYWTLTLLRVIVNLLAVPRLQSRMPSRFPFVSIVVPARDEERTIERAVRGMLGQTYPELEVIVVDDRSTDATGAILARIAAENARLVVVTGEEPPPGWLGKPWALHQGSLRARGELLLFVDADVIYTPDAVASAVAHVEGREVPLLSLFPRLEMHGFWEHVAMPNLAVFAYMIMPLWLVNRSRAAVLAMGGGPGNLVRRADYDAAGGHAPLQAAVVDDVGLARHFRRSGLRTEIVRADEMVSVRMYDGLREVIDGFTKNSFAVVSRSYVLVAFFLSMGALFHILPYVLALTGDRVALAAVGVLTLARVILFSVLHYRLDNALFGHPLMMMLWAGIMLRSVWLTGIRRRLHWRGRTYDAARTRFGGD
ncbi:MAG TPA: glycosyltransferase [Thermoanaerobaculia bacterium]|nr:glycosyltransferase [Thermoanaerobaculia bacterium]